RRPVKLPGPVVTAMRSSSLNSVWAASITRAISGMMASAWPRDMGSDSLATMAPRSVSSTAAEQASSAVSMARTRMGQMEVRGCPAGRGLDDSVAYRISRPASALHPLWRGSGGGRPHLDHVGHVVLEQVLD